MQGFSINIPMLILFSFIAIYYIFLAFLSILRKNGLEQALVELNLAIDNNSEIFNSLEARRGDAISQEVIYKEMGSVHFVQQLKEEFVAFTGKHPWLLVFLFPIVLGLGFGLTIILFEFADLRINLIALLLMLIFIFASDFLEVPDLLKYANRISKREYLYPADKEYLEKSILLIKSRTKHLIYLVILIMVTPFLLDYILNILFIFMARILFSEYFFGSFLNQTSDPSLITLFQLFFFAFILLLLITLFVRAVTYFFRTLFKSPLEEKLFEKKSSLSKYFNDIHNYYSGIKVFRLFWEHYYLFLVPTGIIISSLITLDQLKYFTYPIYLDNILKLLSPGSMFFLLWLSFWIILKIILKRIVEKAVYKEPVKRFQIDKNPNMLKNIFQHYDSIKYLDMAQLLKLHHEYHLLPWLKSLGSVPGLQLEDNQLTLNYTDIEPYIEGIIRKYENYSFIKQLS